MMIKIKLKKLHLKILDKFQTLIKLPFKKKIIFFQIKKKMKKLTMKILIKTFLSKVQTPMKPFNF